MKHFFLTLVLAACAMLAFSQQKEDYDFSINGHRISTKNDFKTLVSKVRRGNFRTSFSDEDYVFVQFFRIPSAAELDFFRKRGLSIVKHFDKTTYYGRVKAHFLRNPRARRHIRTIIPLQPAHKISPQLVGRKIPAYAREKGNIKVIISYFELERGRVSSDLRALAVPQYRINEDFEQVVAHLPPGILQEVAALNWVQHIELVPPPAKFKNTPGRSSHRANILQSEGQYGGYGLSGKGVRIGLWDANVQKHPDCSGRMVNREYEFESPHGSHVFGTMAGGGILDPKAKGMAPEAKAFCWNFNVQSNGLFVYEERMKCAKEDSIELTQNSFGSSLQMSVSNYRYNAQERGDDLVTSKIPYLLNVYASGNEQAKNAGKGGFSTSPQNGKNALHVGANDPDEKISNYSSFGPTSDGRIVPQISAIGSSVYSMNYGNGYTTMSGTSMATPGVSGTIALLYEYYKKKYGGKRPSAALIKALVCNTAQDQGNPGPDYKYGYGNFDGLRALKALENEAFFEGNIGQAEVRKQHIEVPKGVKKLKVLLCYSDLPGTPGNAKVLVNDLDLEVVKDGKTYLPWVLNPRKPAAAAVRGIDDLNNVEQITIDNPPPGNYTLVVKGTHIPGKKQAYALSYDLHTPTLRLTYPNGGEYFAPGDTEYIRWDYIGRETPFSIEYSTDNGLSYQKIAENLPPSARTLKWEVPEIIGNQIKIRLIAGTKVSFSEKALSIMHRPKNLVADGATACGMTNFTMKWDSIPGASYEILKLTDQTKFVKIAETDSSQYSFSNTKSGENNWFTVRAIDKRTGAKSERAIAIKINPRTPLVLTPESLPYTEDFESLQLDHFTFSGANPKTGYAGLGYYDTTFKNAAIMGGFGKAQEKPWVKSGVAGFGFAQITNAFQNNPDYIKRLVYCDFDATKLAGKHLTLNFDLKYHSPTGSSNRIFFRVLANGKTLTSTDKKKYYAGINGKHSPFYDLSAYAGKVFTLVFEAVLDDKIMNAATQAAIILGIDNIKVAEASADMAVTYGYTVKKPTAADKAAPVIIRVQNLSPETVSDIPVSYTVNGKNEVKEIIRKKIPPFNNYTYTFNAKADLSRQGLYKIALQVNHPADKQPKNNSFNLKPSLNLGDDIVLGESAATAGNPPYNYTTCAATFTDDGTRFGVYKNSRQGFPPKVAVFKPATEGAKIKVDFTAFNLEDDFDFLEVFNGPDTDAPLLARLTGNKLPPALISTAESGTLTFRFLPDNNTSAEGWIAKITCITPQNLLEAQALRITNPPIINRKSDKTPITLVVQNLSPHTRRDIPVFYRINNGKKIQERIKTAVEPQEKKTYTFKTTADMAAQEGDFAYLIEAGIDQQDLMPQNNTVKYTVYNKYGLPNHTHAGRYAISRLKWGDIVQNSGITPYSDFKNVLIPVVKTQLYVPEVEITTPDLPLSKYFNQAAAGAFTMMVIDLNNDGDYSDEFYTGNFWVNTGLDDDHYPSTKSTHYFKKALNNEPGVRIPADTPAGKHPVRFIHMFRTHNEDYNIILGPTKDGVNTAHSDFEIEEYTLDVREKPAADVALTQIIQTVPQKTKPSVVVAEVQNNGTADVSHFEVAYQLNSEEEVTEIFTDTLAAGKSKRYTFAQKADLRTEKNHTLSVYTKLATDANPANDRKTTEIVHAKDHPQNLAATFDGGQNCAVAPPAADLDLTQDYTFEAWVNQTEKATLKDGGLPRIMDKNTVKIFINNTLSEIYSKNSFVFYFLTDKGEYILNTEANTVKLKQWQQLALSVSKTNDYKVFLDGIPQALKRINTENATAEAGAAKSNRNDALYLGNQAAKNRGFVGQIDEVRIWQTEKSAEEIAANALQKPAKNAQNLAAYYNFDEQSGVFVYDRSATDNTAQTTHTETDTFGEGKFRRIPKLLENISAKNQIGSTFDAQTKTYTLYLPKVKPDSAPVLTYDLHLHPLVKIDGKIQKNGDPVRNYDKPLKVTVEGQGFNSNLTETYTLRIRTGLQQTAELRRYDFLAADNSRLNRDIQTKIQGVNATASLPKQTETDSLIATFAVSPGATLYINGEPQEQGKTLPLNYGERRIVKVVAQNPLFSTYYEVFLKQPKGTTNGRLALEAVLNTPHRRANRPVVYPNPVTGNKINIHTNSGAEKEIFLFSLSGKLLRHLKGQQSVEVSGLENGMYLLKVFEGDNVWVEKIVIRR